MSERQRHVRLRVSIGVAVVLTGAIAYVQSLESENLECTVSRTQIGDTVYEMPICQ